MSGPDRGGRICLPPKKKVGEVIDAAIGRNDDGSLYIQSISTWALVSLTRPTKSELVMGQSK